MRARTGDWVAKEFLETSPRCGAKERAPGGVWGVSVDGAPAQPDERALTVRAGNVSIRYDERAAAPGGGGAGGAGGGGVPGAVGGGGLQRLHLPPGSHTLTAPGCKLRINLR